MNMSSRPDKRRKITKRTLLSMGVVLLLAFGSLAFWLGPTVFKVAPNAGIINSFIRSIPGVNDSIQQTEAKQTNIILLGMRGEGVEGGGLLADTIMVATIAEGSNEVSLLSIPRDLYVTIPESQEKQKINAVHARGEEQGRGKGLEYMKTILSEVLGSEMHYAVSINFAGFEQLIDALGGVDLYLEEPFVEPVQFHKEQVCDPNVFTVPSGNYEEKINQKTGKIKARYPLCYNADEECGGVFEVPAGEVNLSGEQALCYVRARETSSDFDRARRQQEVIKEIKDKVRELGVISDIGKINGMIDALGNNIRTDMQLWEMKRFLELAQTYQDPDISQGVLENSEEGLLYSPEDSQGAGYILLPRGDTYDRIHQMFAEFIPQASPEEAQE